MFHRFFEPDLYESPSFGFPEQFHILIPYVGFRLLVDGHATRDAETLPDTGAYGFVFRGPVNRKSFQNGASSSRCTGISSNS